jgi:hypothetical protein
MWRCRGRRYSSSSKGKRKRKKGKRHSKWVWKAEALALGKQMALPVGELDRGAGAEEVDGAASLRQRE